MEVQALAERDPYRSLHSAAITMAVRAVLQRALIYGLLGGLWWIAIAKLLDDASWAEAFTTGAYFAGGMTIFLVAYLSYRRFANRNAKPS